jgi:hypothetical protein
MPNAKKKLAPARRKSKTTTKHKRRAAMPLDAAIVKTGDNPYGRDSGRYKRLNAILRSKTVGEALKKGAKRSSLRAARLLKVVRIVPMPRRRAA